MDILLDTHALLWHLSDNPRLSLAQSGFISNTQHRKFVSIVSLWEIAIKTSSGKLEVVGPLASLVPDHMTILPLRLPHLLKIQALPFHHRDPFDRAIIAQALTENLTVLSIDSKFAAYGVTLI